MLILKIFQKQSRENTDELNHAIITSLESPFASTVYDHTKPIKFFVGRENEIKRILQVVQHVINDAQSKGISLEGAGGCGKSTLFGYINQIIHQGKLTDYPSFLLDMKVFTVFSTYIIAPTNADTFLKLWPSIFEGLEEHDYSFFEHLAFLFLAKLFDIFQEHPNKLSEYGKLIWTEESRIPLQIKKSGFHRVSWQDIKEELFHGNLSVQIPKIINFIIRNGRTIVYHTSIPAGTHPLLPTRINLDRVRSLPKLEKFLTILGEDTSILNSFYCRDQRVIIDDDQAFEWFNFFANLYRWITGKIPCFLIGVDEIGKITGGEADRRKYYQGFYNTLIRMRNMLKFVVFVLIGTTDDWKKMNDFIRDNTDLYYQIQGFLIENIFLEPLEHELIQQIFKNRIEEFWKNRPVQPRSMRWYPYSEPVFDYVYNYTGLQLRESLNLLNQVWREFRLSQEIKIIDNYLTAMQLIRTIENDWPHNFLVDSFHEFERNALLDDFWDPQTFKTDTERSNFCEKALTDGFELLAHEDHPHYVDRARNNPSFPIIINGRKKRRKPDVYVELFGQLGPERARRVEFQVKIYSETSFVTFKDLESSFEIFQAGLTDLLYLIMTGKGLDPTAMMNAQQLGNRIMGLQPINKTQLLALILLGRYKEITGIELSPDIVKALLAQILNQPWDNFIADIKLLPKNYGIEPILQLPISQPPIIPTIKTPKTIPLTQYTSKPQPQPSIKVEEIKEISKPTKTAVKVEIELTWINQFPTNLSDCQKEIKYLFNLVITRGGRFYGQTTLTYLLKNVPLELSKDKLKILFKTLPKDTSYFIKRKTSIVITEEGKKIASRILS